MVMVMDKANKHMVMSHDQLYLTARRVQGMGWDQPIYCDEPTVFFEGTWPVHGKIGFVFQYGFVIDKGILIYNSNSHEK